MNNTHRILLGILIGALAMWIYDHREEIGLLASNRGKLSGAGKIWAGLKEIAQP